MRLSIGTALALLVLSAPGAASAPASSPAPAETLLARWARAVGGTERLRSVRAVHSRARVQGTEGAGQVEEWSTSRGQRRQVSETESGVEISVFDGARGWQANDGQVRALSPDEMRGQRSAAGAASYNQLVPGRMSGITESLGREGPDSLHVLRITPRGGRPTRCYLDPRTFLPVRSERDLGSTTLTITYHDWRDAEGIRVAGRIELSTADSGYVATETLEEIRFNPRLEPGLFSRPAEGPADFRFDDASGIARIPIEIRDHHIFFRGSINDSLVWLTIDTGAYGHVIDVDHARALGVPFVGAGRIFGAVGSTESARVRGLSIDLPGVRLERQSFATTPLGFLGAAIGLPVVAILGYDIFSRFVVEIDYDGGQMVLHDPARYRYRGRGTILPITLRENHPYVQATIRLPDGSVAGGEFVIDAGSGSTLMLAADFAAAHGLPEALTHRLQARGDAVGGVLRTVAGRLPSLRVGPYQVDDPVVMFPKDDITAPGSAGNIGGRFLRRFRVTFDYRQLRMILEPTPRFAEREEYDMSGVALSTPPGQAAVRVDRVRPKSPGDEAGVKPGDLLERIDGRPAADLSLDAIRALFRVERSYELLLRRDERPVTVTITTRRVL